MSEPKRYRWMVNAENDFDLIEHPQGEYVLYADYAALQAENETLLNPEKFPHRFAETCFLAGYRQGIKDAKGVQS